MSASVKAYVALRMVGDAADAPHMVRARDAILAAGGAAHSNVFTRTSLALFGMVPWRAVPVMPIEIMNAPSWFPFHIYRISYWARDTLVPLLVLMALKPRGVNPRGIDIPELFVTPPDRVRIWPKGTNQVGGWGIIFGALDKVLQAAEPYFPKGKRQSAIDKAVAFVRARLNGEDGLGAIYPAMANTVMMFRVLGVPDDHPDAVLARAAVDKLLAIKGEEAFCQPALSPVWDTALSAHALIEAGGDHAAAADRGLAWLKPLQVLDVKGDWAEQRPDVRPGGWAFQYRNDYYPDLDDTAVVVMAMDRARAQSGEAGFDESIARAREWVVGLQSKNGGWAAFDADNTSTYLNYIPFADHGALLDPPTSDVTARVVSMLAQLGETPADSPAMKRGIDFLLAEQHPEGGWYGRWGFNYVYGTWSVLCALNAAGLAADAAPVRRAVAWLVSIQNADGGWGEDDKGYDLDYRGYNPAPSHRVADRLGGDRPDGGRRGRPPRGRARRRLPARQPDGGRLLARGAVHRHRLPARLLPALPRLPEVLPAVGAGALPQPQALELAHRHGGHVTDVPRGLPPVLLVAGLVAEARIAAGPGAVAVAGGGDAARLALLVEAAIRRGARAVLSFGIAGGLEPGLARHRAGRARRPRRRPAARPPTRHGRSGSRRCSRAPGSPTSPASTPRRPGRPTRRRCAAAPAPPRSTWNPTSPPASRRGTACPSRPCAWWPTRPSGACRRRRWWACGRTARPTSAPCCARSAAARARLPALVRTGLDARAAFAALAGEPRRPAVRCSDGGAAAKVDGRPSSAPAPTRPNSARADGPRPILVAAVRTAASVAAGAARCRRAAGRASEGAESVRRR